MGYKKRISQASWLENLMQKLEQKKLVKSRKIMRSEQPPSIHLSCDQDAIPLITLSTFVQAADESVQPQALSHGESGTSGPVSSPTPAVTRNEATETGAKHSSSAIHSRSDQSTEWKMSAVEGVVLHLRSWYNYCCYCEVSEVKKCVENYCGSVWTDFSNLVGLRLSLHRKQPIKHRS